MLKSPFTWEAEEYPQLRRDFFGEIAMFKKNFTIVCLIVLALAGSASAAICWGTGCCDVVITDYQEETAAYPGYAPYDFCTLTIESGGSLIVSGSSVYSGGTNAATVTVNDGGLLQVSSGAGFLYAGYDYDVQWTQNGGTVQTTHLNIGRAAGTSAKSARFT